MGIRVRGSLDLDGTGWEKGIRKAEEEVDHLGNEGLADLKNMVLEAFTVGAVEEFVRGIVETAVHIKQASEQFGVSTDQVQQLGRAANRVGLEFEDVGRWMEKLGKTRREAGEQEGEALRHLQKYGLTLEDIRNPALNNLALMLKMRDAMEDLGKTAEGRDELDEFFGKSGAKALAVFDEFKNAPPIILITDEQVAKIDEAEKKLKDLKKTMEARTVDQLDTFAHIFSGDSVKNKEKAALKWFVHGVTMFLPSNIGAAVDRTIDGPKSIDPARDYGAASGSGQSNAQIFKYKRTAEMNEELHRSEEKANESGLNSQQKLQQLLGERRAVQVKLESPKETDAQRDKDTVKANNLDAEIKNLALHERRAPAPKDALISVGNFLGGGKNSISSIGERTNQLLVEISQTLKSIHGSGKALAHSSGAPPF